MRSLSHPMAMELAAEMARSDQALRVIGSVERRGKGYGWAALDLFGRQRIDGYMFDVEILYLAQRAGYHIAQVPVRWRDDGDSRLALLSSNVRNLFDILYLCFGKPQAARVSQEDGSLM